MLLRVLVVEDDPAVLEFMAEVLRSHGLEVCPVGDSREAAEFIDQQKFDAVFLDLHMPGLDGFQLARRTRASSWNKTTPVIIITGRTDHQTLAKAFEAGASFFLGKPVDLQKLTHLFRSVHGQMLEERLRFRRVALSTEVLFEIGLQTQKGTSVHLSQEGMLLDAGAALNRGNSVRLSFWLPGEPRKIEAAGVVDQVDARQRVRIRFTWLSREGRQSIRKLAAAS